MGAVRFIFVHLIHCFVSDQQSEDKDNEVTYSGEITLETFTLNGYLDV